MENILVNAKTILVIWSDDKDPERLPAFQQIIQGKTKQAQIAFENVQMLVNCKFNRTCLVE
jgi:hypothetical protein